MPEIYRRILDRSHFKIAIQKNQVVRDTLKYQVFEMSLLFFSYSLLPDAREPLVQIATQVRQLFGEEMQTEILSVMLVGFIGNSML